MSFQAALESVPLGARTLDGLANALHRELPQVGAAAAAFGILFHQTVAKNLQVEEHLYQLITLGLLSPVVVILIEQL